MFRDKKRHLNLYNIAKQERVTLLNYSGYVQWVPGSDVVVAQSRDNLCVWYSINTPDRVSMFPIKGEAAFCSFLYCHVLSLYCPSPEASFLWRYR